MCGIAGWVGGARNAREVFHSLAPRGPDGSGDVTLDVGGQTVWLAHTRLAVLDVSAAGDQPMVSRSGRWWVSYNGEIYNHLAIRKTLSGPFKGHSDTETLVEALDAWGLHPTLRKLNGMYAFAALDFQTRTLYLARDPFGIKPLYYAFGRDGRFGFASLLRALRAGWDEAPDLDYASLQTFLTLRYVPADGTLLEGCRKLAPGHVLTMDVEHRRCSTERFVEATSQRFGGSFEDAVVEYQNMFSQAVSRQLLSDVPVGILLSGGIDSALVAASCRDQGGERCTTYTVGFGNSHPECEIEDAEDTAHTLGFRHESVEVTGQTLLDTMDDVVGAVEEPLGTTSVLPMLHLAKLARQESTVVLTGQGSDEPWGGYRRHQIELVRALIPFAKVRWLISEARHALAWLPESIERALRALSFENFAERYREVHALFNARERHALTGDDGSGFADESITRWVSWLREVPMTHTERMMRIDARTSLADDLLLYGDKITMFTGLEARVPMLDMELMGFIESLPIEFRVRLWRSKVLHRVMARRYLPRRIVERRKKGFQVPFGPYSRGPWRTWVEDRLLDPAGPHLSVLSRSAVETLWREHLQGRPDRSRQIFALLSLAIWWRMCINARA